MSVCEAVREFYNWFVSGQAQYNRLVQGATRTRACKSLYTCKCNDLERDVKFHFTPFLTVQPLENNNLINKTSKQ